MVFKSLCKATKAIQIIADFPVTTYGVRALRKYIV